MKHVLSILALAAPLLLGATTSHAAITTYRATMSGPSETPPNNSPGYSISMIDIDTTAMTISMRIPFADLVSPTTVAHLHCCTPTPFTGDAAPASMLPSLMDFPVGVTSGLYEHTFSLRDASFYNPAFLSANGGTPEAAAAALISGVNANQSYLNIHTNRYPEGEIRGFLVNVATPVPEPGSWAMLGIGLAGIGFCYRRRA